MLSQTFLIYNVITFTALSFFIVDICYINNYHFPFIPKNIRLLSTCKKQGMSKRLTVNNVKRKKIIVFPIRTSKYQQNSKLKTIDKHKHPRNVLQFQSLSNPYIYIVLQYLHSLQVITRY